MKTDRKFFKTILGISLFIVIGGFVASFIVSNKIDSRERKTLGIRADNASIVFTSEEIRNLKGNEEDLNNGYYFDIKNKLLALRRANPDARFVYLMGANLPTLNQSLLKTILHQDRHMTKQHLMI